MTDRRAEAAEAKAQALEAQVAEQRAELMGTLSALFRGIPACYDTPADHYREMARRLVEGRDALKHETRKLNEQVEALTAEHKQHKVIIAEIAEQMRNEAVSHQQCGAHCEARDRALYAWADALEARRQ